MRNIALVFSLINYVDASKVSDDKSKSVPICKDSVFGKKGLEVSGLSVIKYLS